MNKAKDYKILIRLTKKDFEKIEEFSNKLTLQRAQEDVENKIPPSRRRRSASLSTAAWVLIEKGLFSLDQTDKEWHALNKKIITIIVLFFVLCAGMITYIQIDKYQAEKAIKSKEQEQIQKIQESLNKTINTPIKPISEGKGNFK